MVKAYFSSPGEPTFHWQFYKVPLNAAKPFQVVFEVRKGNEESSGGFSIDDINLSQSECPHNVWQIKDFEELLTSADYNSYLLSPRVYSEEGYAYQMLIALRETFFGVYFRLVSGEYDSTLEWPCPWRQLTLIMLDQNPHIQQQMSKQISPTTDPSSSESIKEIYQPLTSFCNTVTTDMDMFSVFLKLFLTTLGEREDELEGTEKLYM